MERENHESNENSKKSISHKNQETDYEVATNIRVFRPEPRNLEESITAQSHLLDNVNQNKDQEIENFFNMDLNGPSPKDEKTNFQPNESGQKTYITKIPNNLASNKKARYKTGFNDNWIDPNSQCYKDWSKN